MFVKHEGDTTYAGSYRIVYMECGARFLEVRRASGFVRVTTPIPAHVRGAYAAANHFHV